MLENVRPAKEFRSRLVWMAGCLKPAEANPIEHEEHQGDGQREDLTTGLR